MATAAKVTVVEADRLVPTGVIDPDDVHLPALREADRRGPRAPRRHRAPDHARPGQKLTDATRTRKGARELDARADGPPRRRRGEARADRQPGDRDADRGGELHRPGGQRDAAVGERPARHGPLPARGRDRRPPHQRRQGDGHRPARRQPVRLGAVVRHDPRRPHRPGDSRRAGGRLQRRPGQLDRPRPPHHRDGRGDGSGRRRPPAGGAAEPRLEGRRPQAGQPADAPRRPRSPA